MLGEAHFIIPRFLDRTFEVRFKVSLEMQIQIQYGWFMCSACQLRLLMLYVRTKCRMLQTLIKAYLARSREEVF
jgi:hypothetical protein